MNDFLGRLAQRALAPAPAVRPRLASPFEPLAGAAATAPAELDPRPTVESPAAQPSASDLPGLVRNDQTESRPDEPAIRRPSLTPLTGSNLTLSAAANPLPRPASGERAAGRGEGNAPSNRPASPLPSRSTAGDDGEKNDPLPQPPLASMTAARGPAPSVGSPTRPVPPAIFEHNHLPPSQPAEGRHTPLRNDGQPVPLARDDTPSFSSPKPAAVPPRAASRIIHPHVRLPDPATAATDAGRSSTPSVPAAAPVAAMPPDVHITIGRVEIRAMTPPAPPRASSRPAPRVSLDDYLKQTAGGRR